VKKLIYHIIRLALVFIPVALTVAPAMAQLEVNQCEITELSVVDMPGDTYRWDIYRDSTVNFASTDGDVDPAEYFLGGINTGSTVSVNWKEPGRYFFRVMAWDSENCTNNLKLGIIDVIEAKPFATLEGDSVCIGDPAQLKITFTGSGPWTITYTYGEGTDQIEVPDIDESEYVIPIAPGPLTTTEYWIMKVSDTCTTNDEPTEKVKVTVYPKPTNSRIYLKE